MVRRKVNIGEALLVAIKTRDAYSFPAYGEVGWRACCKMLARQGYSAEQIEDIMRAKFTRWAGDGSQNRYGRFTSKDLDRFLSSSHITPENLKYQW